MARPVLLEICVESLECAVAAERGGADRIELCEDLSCGGVTPKSELMRAVREQVQIPVYALIRPRAGDFCYSQLEFETMQREIAVAKETGLNGIVLGLLDSSRQVAGERTRTLVQLAAPLASTFHRAFDQCPDLTAALEEVIRTGAERILTSGGAPAVTDSLVKISQLVEQARGRILIMPGGAIRCHNVERVLQTTGAGEIHTSLGGSTERRPDVFERTVREFKDKLERFVGN
jgi:copper homeostasis protein